MATRYLYLVRHGQYDPDAESSDGLGGELTKIGHQQAARTAKALAQHPITHIHYSTLRRAAQTALHMIEALPNAKRQHTRRLWECIPYVSPEMEDMFENISPEDLAADRKRAESAFAHYCKATRGADNHEILVAHANLIRYFACRALSVNPVAWLNMESHNCGITRIRVDSDGYCMLVSYNDIGHLPPKLRTDNLFI